MLPIFSWMPICLVLLGPVLAPVVVHLLWGFAAVAAAAVVSGSMCPTLSSLHILWLCTAMIAPARNHNFHIPNLCRRKHISPFLRRKVIRETRGVVVVLVLHGRLPLLVCVVSTSDFVVVVSPFLVLF